ncbi:acrosin-binding protein-like [Neopsephotus bourkii]|uniref:acrosin-binding protein-like n=1 Tax=Neopsephotus bourkii TaxID=309878 RepID=UPI002AA572F6|nr:acrosin-binding protein-like [Neopsephotus bourkii]
MSATQACLVLFVLLGLGCNASPHGGKAQQPGTPLSDEEYLQFFSFMLTAGRATTACLLRMQYGCQYPLVQRLDAYENHGVIPEGPVCSELPKSPIFPDFCTFSFYRCTKKKYFIKRIACPGDSKAKLDSTRAFNDMSTNAVSSSIFSTDPLLRLRSKTAQPSRSSPDKEVVVRAPALPRKIPSSLLAGMPQSKRMQLNPSYPHATEVRAGGQQQGQVPTTDMQDLLLRLQDTQVQSALQRLKLLATGKAVPEEELRSAAWKLLVALNNARVPQQATGTDKRHRREK